MTSYMVQLIHGTQQRRDLIMTHWYGGLLLNSMKIVPVTTPLHYTLPQIGSMRAYQRDTNMWDDYIAPSHTTLPDTNIGSALWSRTFDILPFRYYQYPSIDIIDNDDNHSYRCSTIECLSYKNPYIHGKFLTTPVYGASAAHPSECSVGCLQPLFPGLHKTRCRVFDYQRQSQYAFDMDWECNDFTAISIHRFECAVLPL